MGRTLSSRASQSSKADECGVQHSRQRTQRIIATTSRARARVPGRALQAPKFQEVAELQILPQGRSGGGEPEAKRARRERENAEAIGGLRNTHVGLRKVPGWAEVGPTVRDIISAAVTNGQEEMAEQRS